MRLFDILKHKGTKVYAISADATLREVVDALVRHNIGSLIVSETGGSGDDVQPLGIITERDVLRSLARYGPPLEKLRVGDVLSAGLVSAAPHDSLEEGMQRMTHHRVRHLPVLERGGRLCGIVSIGDLVKARHDQLKMENFFMQSYIRGEGAEIGTSLD